MDRNTQLQIELSAVLDTFQYLDIKFEPGTKLGSIISTLEVENPKNEFGKSVTDSIEFQQIKAALIANPKWQEITLVNQSCNEIRDTKTGDIANKSWMKNGSERLTDDLIQAATFVDEEGNYYVAYRGTGEGRWHDNADGMTERSTEMQRAAAEYFDYVAQNYMQDAYANGKSIIVTGHSKGGNEAQYVMLASKYNYMIDRCYSLDGQGFSKEAVKYFKELLGEEGYSEKLMQMYSICGDNDYVHGLGMKIIPEENTYYLDCQFESIKSLHHISYITGTVTGETATYDGLHWKTENGEIINGEPGVVCEFVDKLSEYMLELGDEDLRGAAIVLMNIVDYILAEDRENWRTIGDVDLNLDDGVDFFAHGLPTVLKTLFLSEEGVEFIGVLMKNLVTSLYNGGLINGVSGIPAVIGGYVAVSLALVVFAPFLQAFAVAATILVIDAKILDAFIDIARTIETIKQKVIEGFINIRNMVISSIDKIISKLISFIASGRGAAGSQISVDTYKLSTYAQRISAVNRRITALDHRLDSLYGRVGLRDLWNLLQADILTGYSWRLTRCTSYLNETAYSFNKLENELAAKI